MATKKLKAVAAAAKTFVGDDVMLDLETLSTDVDGVILSMGACRFNETEIDNNGFYRVITIQSNLDEGRKISPSTLVWWLGQTDRAKAVLTDPAAIPLGQALDEFREWMGKDTGNTRVWGNGADFDISMVKHAYGSQDTPWIFWNVRCFRTIKSMLAARNVPKPPNVGAHNALFDAIAQTQHLQALWAAGVGK